MRLNQLEPTFFLCELMKETGLSNAHVSDNDVLEDVRVVVRCRRHDDLGQR